MPIYEYTCKSCNARFEQLVKSMNGQAKVKCPKCGSPQAQRAFSVFAVGTEAPKGGGGHSHGGGCACCSSAGTCPMAAE